MISFVALHRSSEADDLQKHKPHAFLLLCQIARRARYKPSKLEDLDVGEALIGDFLSAGIPSEGKYRQAKKILAKLEYATFRKTSKGTVATLLDSAIFSMKAKGNNEQNDGLTTGKRRLTYNDTNNTRSTRGLNSAPAGAANDGCAIAGMGLGDAKAIARELADKDRKNPDNPFAMYEVGTIESWAETWFHTTNGSGGFVNGRKLNDPPSALKGYLMQWAINKGRKGLKIREIKPDDCDEEIPF